MADLEVAGAATSVFSEHWLVELMEARFREYTQQLEELHSKTRKLPKPPGTWASDVITFEKLDLRTINPRFYDFGNSARPLFDEMETFKSGGSAQVFRVLICPSHIGDHRKDYASHYAVKKLHNESFQDYSRERDAYEKLRLAQNPHRHIVPLLASYRMDDKYHFVFPSAECDLAMYWRLTSDPDKRCLQWFGGQMLGLADALSTVHGTRQESKRPDFYGVHGDIKPENILCFGGDDKWTTFALTDFGSSYFVPPELSRNVDRKCLKHTPAYRAPEVDTTSEGVTQAYDVWSLGCVFVEAVAWFVSGKAGVAKLAETRFDREDDSPNRDAFFRLTWDRKGGLSARLKPEVQRLLVSLREHPRSSPFIEDMLHLVMGGMLRVDMRKRMTSREVFDALTEMCKKLERDPAYFKPRGGPINDVEMATFFETQYSSTRSISLTTSGFQDHTNQNVSRRQRLDGAVDLNYYTDTTTQSFSEASNQNSLKPRFACPFHKAKISVSVHHRACEGPGWTDVNKVKEHVFRCHLPKKYKGKHICRRCDSSFETDELLLAHQHQEPPCPNSNPEPIYGMITREQAARLRSLKRKSTKVTDEDRWFDIYRITNPSFDRRVDNISPYHESNSTSLSTLNSTSSNGISQYKEYLRKRDVEEYAAKLAGMGIAVSLEAAAKLLEVQLEDIETFDETMREPIRTYGIPTKVNHKRVDIGSIAPTQERALRCSDLLNQFQFLPRFDNTEEH